MDKYGKQRIFKKFIRRNINILAKGYLNERLPKEIQSIEQLIHSNTNLISKENIEIITELTSWLENLVNSFINDSTPPKIEKRIQTFIDFVNERGGSYFDNEDDVKNIFNELNKNLFFKSNDIENKIYTYGVYDKLDKNVLEKCELILANSDKKELINAKEKNNIFEKYQNQLNLSMKLRKILINDDIIPFYQPIYGTHNNNKIIKYEVLMRVKDGDKILTPAEFVSSKELFEYLKDKVDMIQGYYIGKPEPYLI